MKSLVLKNLPIITFFTFMLSVSASFGAPPAKPSAGPKVEPVKCTTPPDTQVVNNAGVKIHQVKVGNVILQENLSTCTDGCSTGFKTVNKGQNQVAVKMNSTSAWVSLGSLGKFEECTHYAVNLIKKDKKLCAELFLRKNTDPTFNNDPTKQKMRETCQTMTTITGPEKPAVSTGMTPAAQARANLPGQTPAGAVTQKPGQMQMSLPKPVIENVFFKRTIPGEGDPTMMSAPARIPGTGSGSAESVPTIRAEYGERLTFNCGFTTKNVESLLVRFVYDNGNHSNPSYGTPRDLPDGKKQYWFQTNHIVREDELLTFRVIGTAPGLGGTTQVEKQVRIDSRSPVLELRHPEFNDDTREVTFRVKNTGDMAFPSSGEIILNYEVKGMPGNESIVRSALLGRNITINRDHIAPIGTITLPDTVLNYDRIEMAVTMRAKCNIEYLPEKNYTFNHSQETHTFTIDENLLRVVGGLFSGNVRINTFEDGHGDRSDTQPFTADDSRLVLNVRNTRGGSTPVFNQAIPISWYRFGSDGVEAYVYIDDLTARIDGTNLFFIRDGKLGLRITFNCSASKEIEVWARDAIAKCW
ncbi:MAG: hypothetical protein EHM45_12285, partial [Desulfobacteraceae bacterium]